MAVLDLRMTTTRMGATAYAVALTGELDLPSSSQVERRLGELIEDEARTIVVDLMGVNFIDSAGLGVLLSATRALRSVGGEVVLAADDRRILRLLEITGLDRVMRIEPSFVEAVDYVVRRRRLE
jgi:anti-sigma B factor antagonist